MRFQIILSALFFLLFSACVSNKKFSAELLARQQAEARESVLVKEVLTRREENSGLVQKVGDLNRELGNLDAEIRDLQSELTKRTIQMGESSSKLSDEKSRIENDLASKTAALSQCNYTLQNLKTAQGKRDETLQNLQKQVLVQYPASSGATVSMDGAHVLLTLPDEKLFDANGMALGASGKAYLKPLAELLTQRPEINAYVEAHTDNAVPKDKTISDTWDWSLRRASLLVRTLITEYNVNANQLTPVGRGEFYPLTSNETAEGRRKNRRTVVVLTPPLNALPKVD